MLRVRLFLASSAVMIGAFVLPGSGRVQDAGLPDTVSAMPAPGGLRAALTAVNDRVSADRSQFLLEIIRRSYTLQGAKLNDPDSLLRSLSAHFDQFGAPQDPANRSRAGAAGSSGAGPAVAAGSEKSTPDTLPLPLPDIWKNTVFGGRATQPSLASAILQSRSAARLYYALLSLDDDTRRWLATQPDLIAELVSQQSSAFLLAAPGFRVKDATVRVPGGAPADPVWEALVGRRANEPADFVRGLLTMNEGRLAYFFGAISQLTPVQLRFALNLDSPDPAQRVDAGRRLYAVFDHVSTGWRIEERPFWRPALDPALLVTDLQADADGRPVLPGTRRFWTAVLADADPAPPKPGREDEGRAYSDGPAADLVWLAEQVFRGPHTVRRRPYHQVLFASRVITGITPATARDSIEAVRAAAIYPALMAALERAGIADVRTLANAARRAHRLSSIGDQARQVRAMAQFQGVLAVLVRAASRRTLSADALSTLVSSLAAVETNERGEYDGRLVRWLVEALDAHTGPRTAPRPSPTAEGQTGEPSALGSVEARMLVLLAGPSTATPQFVEWEGTRYRVDLTSAEATRLTRLLGDRPRPYLSSARTLVTVADALAQAGVTRDRLRQLQEEIEQVSQAADWERDVASALQRATRAGGGDKGQLASLAASLRGLADALLARGLMELAYAVAMGHSDRAVISAGDAASRHDFGLRAPAADRSSPWNLPVAGTERMRDWHVTGSLLGLDVRLAELLARAAVGEAADEPADAERRGPAGVHRDRRRSSSRLMLTDPDRDAIVAAMRQGRARLAAVRTAGGGRRARRRDSLSPPRGAPCCRGSLAHEPARVADFSVAERAAFGSDWARSRRSPAARVGRPRRSRVSAACACSCSIAGRWRCFAGRWESGMLASAFPDLNLRLAELLMELQMPAPLLGPVLASATLDFVNARSAGIRTIAAGSSSSSRRCAPSASSSTWRC